MLAWSSFVFSVFRRGVITFRIKLALELDIIKE
jgi:hypothetical protein